MKRTVASAYDPRRNTFDVVRVSLAVAVAVSHAVVMDTGKDLRVGNTALGDLAVDGFFVLSGFLVTTSLQRLETVYLGDTKWAVARFAWYRFLRIMPGFWVCLLVVALLAAPCAAMLEGRAVSTPFTQEPSAWAYLVNNAGLLILQYDIAGLLAKNPTPFVFNGALWTLVLEALCYALLALLAWTGVVRHRRWMVPALTAVLWSLLVAQRLGVDTVVGDDTTRLALMFFLGAGAYLFAPLVPTGRIWAFASFGALVGCLTLGENYRLLGAAPFAYLIVYLGTCIPRPVRLHTDLSYGIYIYHWPVAQLLMLTPAAALPTAVFVPAAVATVLLPAAASWFLIERAALRQKEFSPARWFASRSQRTRPTKQ